MMTEEQDRSTLSRTRTTAEDILRTSGDPDERARAYLMLGSAYEREGNWAAAIECYGDILAVGPADWRVRYLGNNNLGYSLIQLGRFDEAEGYCLAAIAIDPERHNAHKNLGLVRQGQERWLEAALCFAAAHRRCPEDSRAWHLLEGLLARWPELVSRSEQLRSELADLATDGPGTPGS